MQDLVDLMDKYKEISPDLSDVVLESNLDYEEFRRGFNAERSGQSAGNAWYDKFASLLSPAYILYASLLANKYGVPWGVAYFRMCADNMVPGIDANLAKQEVFHCYLNNAHRSK